MNTTKTIIPQPGQIPNLTFAAPAGGAICKYCATPVNNPYTTPPLCELHLDLAMLLSHMQKQNIPITLANAGTMLTRAINQGGQWTLTHQALPAAFNDLLGGRREN